MKKYIYLIATLIFMTGISTAQIDTVKTPETVPELPGDEVEVIKNFRARLARTNRIQFLPEMPVINNTDQIYSYEVNVRALSLDYPAPVIRPLAMEIDPPVDSYNTLLSFAYGYPRFSFAHLHSAYHITDDLKVGLNYSHQAMANRNYIPVGFYEHTGDIYMDYRVSELLKINAGFLVDIERHQLVSDSTDYEQFRKTNQYKGTLGISTSDNADLPFLYNLGMSFSNVVLNDFDLSESWFEINGEGFYRIGDIKAGADFDYDFVNYDGDSLTGFNSIRLTPKVAYNNRVWDASAGLNMIYENSEATYLPNLQVTSKVILSKLLVSAFAKSEVRLNNWHNVLHINPFLSDLNIRNEKTMLYGVGVSGIFDRLDYSVEGGYKISKDLLAFERNAESDFIAWSGVLKDANSPYISALLYYKVNEIVSVSTDFMYQNYKDSLSNDIEGLYDMEWGIGSKIQLLNNKLCIEPELRMITNIERSTELDHNSFFDLGIDADYQFMKNASVFIKSSNLLNSRNERWAGYKALGIAIAGGVKARF